MSIDLRISDKPYIADITFKDGTTRRIDYALMAHSGGFFQFLSDKEPVWAQIVGPNNEKAWAPITASDVAGHFAYKLEGS